MFYRIPAFKGIDLAPALKSVPILVPLDFLLFAFSLLLDRLGDGSGSVRDGNLGTVRDPISSQTTKQTRGRRGKTDFWASATRNGDTPCTMVYYCNSMNKTSSQRCRRWEWIVFLGGMAGADGDIHSSSPEKREMAINLAFTAVVADPSYANLVVYNCNVIVVSCCSCLHGKQKQKQKMSKKWRNKI